MSRIGALVLTFFGTAWALAAVASAGLSHVALLLPLFAGAVLAVAVSRTARTLPRRSEDEERRIGRLVGWWSMAEFVAIFAAANLLLNLGHPGLAMPAVVAIVGAHFVPLAIGIPYRPYHLVAGALIAVALASLLAPAGITRSVAVTGGAAAVLWVAVLAMVLGWRRRAAVV